MYGKNKSIHLKKINFKKVKENRNKEENIQIQWKEREILEQMNLIRKKSHSDTNIPKLLHR